jgi:hypothetical protein
MGRTQEIWFRSIAATALAFASSVYFLGVEVAWNGVVVIYGFVLSVMLGGVVISLCAFVLLPYSKFEALWEGKPFWALAGSSVIVGTFISHRFADFFSF